MRNLLPRVHNFNKMAATRESSASGSSASSRKKVFCWILKKFAQWK